LGEVDVLKPRCNLCVSHNCELHGIPTDAICCKKLDWLIVGAETGANARYCPIEWIESVVEQCKAAGVPVWVKAVHLPFMKVNSKTGTAKSKFDIIHKFNDLPESVRVRQSPFGVSPKSTKS